MSLFGFGKKKPAAMEIPPEPAVEISPSLPDAVYSPDITPSSDAEDILTLTEVVDSAATASPPAAATTADADAKQGWFARLKAGLQKSTSKFSDSITGLFTKRKLDTDTLQELEDALIMADLGPQLAARLTAEFGRNRFGKEVSDDEVKEALAEQISAILAPHAKPLTITNHPHVVLVIGVNGVGKTTTIGKLARHYTRLGNKVMLAAGDTFRAAAISQLQIWGERTGCTVVTLPQGGDAAALAYTALERARAEGTELLLIDTAGRLHNKTDLMDELAKIIRVIKKQIPDAPHNTLLVLDATTGQNALAQAETFRRMAAITGLIVTKLDGSAKGGMLVALAEKLQLPIHAIGVGEGVDDLRPFTAGDYARALVGLE